MKLETQMAAAAMTDMLLELHVELKYNEVVTPMMKDLVTRLNLACEVLHGDERLTVENLQKIHPRLYKEYQTHLHYLADDDAVLGYAS